MNYQGYRDYRFFCYQTLPRARASGYLPESVEDKLRKLEAEKQSLGLQVSVLSEQVEAQSEKIAELEFQVDDRDNRLMQAQDMLQAPPEVYKDNIPVWTT